MLGLPGQDPATQAWMTTLLDAIGDANDTCTVARYRHWDSDQQPDVKFEAAQIDTTSVDLLVGKSLGTMISLAAHKGYGLAPERAVFIGLPLVAYSDGLRDTLREFASTTPTLFIQQTADRTAAYSDVVECIGDCPQATTVEVAGSNHVYSDIEELRAIITGWLAG